VSEWRRGLKRYQALEKTKKSLHDKTSTVLRIKTCTLNCHPLQRGNEAARAEFQPGAWCNASTRKGRDGFANDACLEHRFYVSRMQGAAHCRVAQRPQLAMSWQAAAGRKGAASAERLFTAAADAAAAKMRGLLVSELLASECAVEAVEA